MDPAAYGPVALDLGERALEAGDLAQVEALMDRRLARAPGDAEAHAMRGVALGGLDRPREAIAAFERALALQPDHPVARENLPVARAAARGDQPK